MKKKGKALLAIWLCIMIAVPAIIKVSAFSPRTTAPGGDNKYFYGSANPYTIGQCTWYAFGRAYEINGSVPTKIPGNAIDWWDNNIKNGYYPYGQTPALGAWACYGGGEENYGHVAVVESIVDGVAIVSEDNYSGTFNYGRAVEDLNQPFYGYIYVCGKPTATTTTETPTTIKTTIEFTDYSSSALASQYSVTKTNAVLVTTVTKTAGAAVSSAGCFLYNSSGERIANFSVTSPAASADTTFSLSCNINDDMGITLDTGTTYKYMFYAISNSTAYYSSTYTFKTGDLAQYTVSYDANGGEDAPSDQTKTESITLVLTTQTPTRNGYVFSGWSTDSTATRAEYKAGSKFTADSDTQLYAVWEELLISGLSLDKERIYLSVGGTLQLNCSLTPAGTAQTVSWESTNPDSATVDSNGLVTGIEKGKSVIIARAGDFIAKCVVETGTQVELTSIQLSDSSINLRVDKTATLYYSLLPSDSTNVDLKWYSTNTDIATVNSSGVVTAKATGNCTIYCEDINSEIYASCRVTVSRSWTDVLLSALKFFANLTISLLDIFAGIE